MPLSNLKFYTPFLRRGGFENRGRPLCATPASAGASPRLERNEIRSTRLGDQGGKNVKRKVHIGSGFRFIEAQLTGIEWPVASSLIIYESISRLKNVETGIYGVSGAAMSKDNATLARYP